MPDYAEPSDDVADFNQRTRFFDGQFLNAQDFIDEQRYHLGRARKAMELLTDPGVCEGLGVQVDEAQTRAAIVVQRGTAVDPRGRLLVVTEPQRIELPAGATAAEVWARYRRSETQEVDGVRTGAVGDPVVAINEASRWSDEPVIALERSADAVRIASVTRVDQTWEIEYDHAALTLPLSGDTVRVDGAVAVGSDLSVARDLRNEGALTVRGVTSTKSLRVDGELTAWGHIMLWPYQGVGKSGTAYLQARDPGNQTSIDLVVRTQQNGDFVDGLAIASNGNVTAEKSLIARGALTVGGDATANGRLVVQGNTTARGTLTVQGNTTANGALTVQGNTNAKGALTVEGDTTAKGALTVQGNTTANGALTVHGQLNAWGHLMLWPYQGIGKDGTALIQARDPGKTNSIGLVVRTQEKGNYVNAIEIASTGDLNVPYKMTIGSKLGIPGFDDVAETLRTLQRDVAKSIKQDASVRITQRSSNRNLDAHQSDSRDWSAVTRDGMTNTRKWTINPAP